MSAAVLVAWLATYALHSTVLLGVAALLSRVLRSDAWRETLWKTALLGGIATATLPALLGYSPVAGSWTAEAATARVVALGPGSAAREPGASGPGNGAAGRVDRAGEERVAERAGRGVAAPVRREPEARDEGGFGAATGTTPGAAGTAPGVAVPWAWLLAVAWIALAGLLLARLGLDHVRLFTALRDRRSMVEGPQAATLAELRRRVGYWTPVRLTVSAACPTPIALGRAEICVPERFVDGLDAEQQRTALAHELAHLRRRDPLWHLAAGIVESVFFFQPLNRLARLRLREAAENLCDDWAARQTGSPLVLARCLTDIASWVAGEPIPERTLAIAEGGSPLLRRIERLAEWREVSAGAAGLRPFAAAALLAAVAVVAPAVSGAASAADRDAAPGLDARGGDTIVPRSPVARDTVIRHPDPSRPLDERWAWAMARRPAGGFWVGWGVERPPVAGPIASSSSGGDDAGAPTPVEILGAERDAGLRAALVFGFAAGPAGDAGVDRILLRSLDDPLDLGGRPLLWLGPATARESLERLGRLHEALDGATLRKEIAAALALHDAPAEVAAAVDALLLRERSAAVRAEALQWLPRLHPRERVMVDLVVRAAEGDAAGAVQREAVDALSNFMRAGAPGAREALVRLAENHPSWTIRSEAAQALAAWEN